MTLSKQAEALERIKEKCKENLLAFAIATDRNFEPFWHHKVIAEKLEQVERGEIKRLIITLPPRHGKQISHDTPVLTPSGWTVHGELKPSDFVFGRNGEKRKVIAVSEDTVSDCVVTFSDGERIQTHENHEWVVFDRRRQRERVVETKELLSSQLSVEGAVGARGHRFRFQVDAPVLVEFPEKKVSIHPYIVGAWLGDGKSNGGTLCGDKKDVAIVEKMVSKGAKLTAQWVQGNTGVHYYSFTGLYPALRKCGLNGEKFIPECYLFNSKNNRLELLAGLIDTDGSRDKKSRYRFSTCSKVLAEQTAYLVRSLGGNAYTMEYQPTLSTSGIHGRKVVYQVGFNLDMEIPVVLKRKRNLRTNFVKRKRAIVSAERTSDVKYGKCIQVEGSVYLVGKNLIPTHNSYLSTEKFPVWYLGKHPEREVGVVAYSAELAETFGYKSRDIAMGEQARAIFNLKLRADSQAKDHWMTEQGGGYSAIGFGGSMTGRGFHLIIIDDPIKNNEEAESQSFRDKQMVFYQATLYTRLYKDAAIVLIQTRWHLDDLAGRLQEEEKNGGDHWEVLNIPAIADTDETYDIKGVPFIRKAGEVIEEKLFSKEEILQKKNVLGSFYFSALYQGQPISSENQEFRKEFFKYIDFDEVTKMSTRRFMTIDTAISKKASGDDTGITLNFVNKENHWHFMTWKLKVSPQELMDFIFQKWEQYRVEQIGIEKTIYLQAVKPFFDEEMRKRNKFPYVTELQHNQINKEVRIRGLLPYYESGSIFHIRGHCDGLEEQLLTFPKGRRDDVIDSAAYQTQIVKKPYDSHEKKIHRFRYASLD